MRRGAGRWRESLAPVAFVVLLATFIAAVLLPGYRLADELSADAAALKLASEHRARPDAIAASLGSIRDRLDAGGYVGGAIDDLRESVSSFERALDALESSAAGPTSELGAARALWARYRERLEPVVAFDGLPYRDTDVGGTEISPAGARLLEDTRAALAFGRSGTASLTGAMSAVGARLQRDVTAGAATLRTLMVAGVVFACALLALLAYVQWLKARHERAANAAREQTRDILATVKDGLFLLDADLRIGNAHSAALATLLSRERFDGLGFEDLLRDLVPGKTLATAVKYVKLLWGERVNENLIRSINPLSEVEVGVDRGDGHRDVKYLEFEFHRVRSGETTRHVLVTVNDVTSRVLLARELRQSQASAQTQMDMLLGVLQVDPGQVTQFLDDSGAALTQVNAILKVPARSAHEFRDKIDLLFREIHRIKGEAAALALPSVETRAHDFEETLQELRQRPALSGSDFLPLVVRLDELMSHLKSVRELLARLDAVRADSLLAQSPASPAPLSEAALDRLARRIAADHGKSVRVVATGLEDVPADLARPLRDVAIQLLRNAVVHGIEPGDARRAAGKDPTGLLQLQVRRGPEGLELVLQDDGAGIDAERVRAAAVRHGLVDAGQAATIDAQAVLALLFRPGFSTRDAADRDAGRGVGLDLVRRTVRTIGGRIGVSTAPGRYTRFRVVIGADPARQSAVA